MKLSQANIEIEMKNLDFKCNAFFSFDSRAAHHCRIYSEASAMSRCCAVP